MAKFYIIDHSLKNREGHHFDYAQCIVDAVRAEGFQPIVAAHRDFQVANSNGVHQDFNDAVVRPVFRDTTYQADSYLAGLQHVTRSKVNDLLDPDAAGSQPRQWWRALKFARHRRRRERFFQRFAGDCRRLFDAHPQRPGDHAFLTTVSELELMGLALYLASDAATLQTQWHLQFHFNLFDGRTPEYASQSELAETIRECFWASLSRLPRHSLRFYATSQTLADQYNSLGIVEFESLPYPISPSFRQPAPAVSLAPTFNSPPETTTHCSVGAAESTCFAGKVDRPPLRMTCAGGIRREKGQSGYLQTLIDQIGPTHLSAGRLKLIVQRPRPNWKKPRAKLDLQIPAPVDQPSAGSGSTHDPRIEYVPHPLSRPDYLRLIQTTDIGLLYYNSRAYFSRRAGVLGELLACGKPVIVSAGSWLADQLEPAQWEHVQSVIRQESVVRSLGVSDVPRQARNVPLPGGVVSFDRVGHPFVADLDRTPDETALAVRFHWHWPREPGVYGDLRLIEFVDGEEQPIRQSRRIVGQSRTGQQAATLFNLDPSTTRLRLEISNAYDDSTASIRHLELTTLAARNGADLPVSQVGRIAADPADLTGCVDELVQHYDHYRRSAELFSDHWYGRHEPRRTIQFLTTHNESIQGRAA